jgi:hypothetical protein
MTKQSYRKTKEDIEHHISCSIDMLQELYEEFRCGDPKLIREFIRNQSFDVSSNDSKYDGRNHLMILVEFYSEQAAALKMALETQKYDLYGKNSKKYDLDWIKYEGGMQ